MTLYHDFIRAAPAAEAMELLFKNLKDVMFCIKDQQDRYLCANEAFTLRVGLNKANSIIGKTTQEVFPQSLALNFRKQDLEVFRTGVSISNRLDIATNSDQSLGWYLSDKVPVHDQQNKIIALASTTRDLRLKVDGNSDMISIVNFVNLMRERFDEPIRIASLAEEAGIPLRKLERRMQSIMSTSPRQLLTRMRVEAVAERLRHSNDSLSELSYRFGFCDQPTFCRQFKNSTGMTATDYRRLFEDTPEIVKTRRGRLG